MNSGLLKLYRALPAVQRESLRGRYPDSPKIQLFLDFLDQCKNEKFTSVQAAHFIYADELKSGIAIPVAVNRFFKLRKKLEESLVHSSGETTENWGANSAFSQYNQALRLMELNQPQSAARKLKQLYQEVREINLFELLPGICDNLIYAQQINLQYKDIESWFERWEEANQLLRDLNKAKFHYRKAFTITFLNTHAEMEPEIQVLRQLAQKHKAFPRFDAIYHFACFTLGSRSFGKSPQSLGKHAKALDFYLGKFPHIPWVNIPEAYFQDNQFSVRITNATFHLRKGNYQKALAEMNSGFDLVKREPLLQRRLSQSLLINKMRLEVLAGLFPEALKTGKMLQELEMKEGNSLLGNCEIARVWLYAFPEQFPPSYPELYESIDLYIVELLKANREFDARDLNGVKMLLLLQEGKIKEARKIWEKNEVVHYFESTGFEPELIERILYLREPDTLLKELEKRMYQSEDPGIEVFYRMLWKTASAFYRE